MRYDVQVAVAGVLLATAVLVPGPARADSTQVLIAHGLVSQDVGDGADLFFRDTFGGNGRTCASCHPQDNNQTLDPAFIATLPASDPLFITDTVPGLEIPELLSQFALILENPDGTEDPTVKFVMRGVPTSLSMSTSITAPAGFPFPDTTGWGGDGGLDGTLHAFSSGAVKQHFTRTLSRVPGTDFIFPTDTQLTKMEAFMRNSGRLADLTLATVTLADPDAEVGRRIFLNSGSDVTIGAGKCNTCHADAGANEADDHTNHNYDVGVEELTHPARAVHDFPHDGGLGTELNSEGTFGDGTFNTPPLVEAADSPPFFHDNVIDNLEDAVAFFSGPEFNASPGAGVVGGIALTLAESDQVAAFLRVINAGLNISISMQRNDAAIKLENSDNTSTCKTCTAPPDGGGTTGVRQTVNTLLALSNVEAADAIEVLNARGLDPDAVTLLQSAISKNQQAINETSSQTRKSLMRSANSDFLSAKSDLGTGLDFSLGEGNLLF